MCGKSCGCHKCVPVCIRNSLDSSMNKATQILHFGRNIDCFCFNFTMFYICIESGDHILSNYRHKKTKYAYLNDFFSSPVWAIVSTLRPSSVCKLFQKSSPLKPLGQYKPNLAWIILRGFPLKDMSDDPVDQPPWPPCL